jgi:N6-adenosine-specific RNA methylase IME4
MTKKTTGYSVYKKKAEEMAKVNDLPNFFPPLPDRKYEIIYADPPWHYNGKMQFDNSGKSADQIDLNKNIFISAAEFKYPTVKTSELKKLPIHEIASDDALLFMWTTNPHLDQAIELGTAWGFDYKTVAFVWDKMVHNPGQYTLSNVEMVLVFKRGRIPKPRGARNVQQLVRSPRRAHSQKPDEIVHLIERMFPTQSKIELFARSRFDNWDAWGLEMLISNEK